jgi:hypothetical protein
MSSHDDDDDDDDKEEEDRPLPVAVETDEGALEFAGEDGSKLRFKQGAISLDQVSPTTARAAHSRYPIGRVVLTNLSIIFCFHPFRRDGWRCRVPTEVVWHNELPFPRSCLIPCSLTYNPLV